MGGFFIFGGRRSRCRWRRRFPGKGVRLNARSCLAQQPSAQSRRKPVTSLLIFLHRCLRCSDPVKRRARGPYPQYCSSACSQAAYRTRKALLITPDDLLRRHAQLVAWIARDTEIANHFTSLHVPRNPDAPRLVFARAHGVGFAALGRKTQAERRLKALEGQMDAELLAKARSVGEEVAGTAAEEANRELNHRNSVTEEWEVWRRQRLSERLRVSEKEEVYGPA